MGKAGGTGLLLAGLVIFFLGLVLRMDLIDWLINLTGLLLILIGVVIGIIGIVSMMTGRSSSSDF